ncbi:hypothetical protein L6164_014713 [Bauhinia variegata]|uniref:Uncharacterized protein n=1 Tax=Bauhinia variegata TaxID=167791 RepID=A0ACB9NI12_BAUVA|nr:hypothetical protein L6164_014713 [Bauhinia variegata]
MSEVASRRHHVGYALEAKKVQSFLQISLIDYAKQRSIDLVQIDVSRPLIEQGPFDCVIHKLYSDDWKKQLDEFSTKHPNVPIIDRPELIDRLQNRVSMLEVVTQLQIPLENETIGIPKQVVVNESIAFQNLDLKFPLIAKPLLADGSASSHKLCMVFDHDGLKTLSAPLVLQEFVNHGGVIFKIYVAGQHVNCVKRKSLPDITQEKLTTLGGTLPFSQISNLSVREEENSNIEKAEMPPPSLVKELARALREAMGLNLFNMDVIRDAADSGRYLVIDINYFPGYAKMPSFEPFFTNFLLDVVQNKTA